MEKINRKVAVILAFCIGFAIFATTAFADVSTKTGYEQFKSTVKDTLAKISNTTDSYTTDQTMTFSEDGKFTSSNENITKKDNKNQISETTTINKNNSNGDSTYYSYNDKEKQITKNSGTLDDTYYVYKHAANSITTSSTSNMFLNPFTQAEGIIDALVMTLNLQDCITVIDNSDNTKTLTSSLSDGQVPMLVNAITSYLFKQSYNTSAQMASIRLSQGVSSGISQKLANSNASPLNLLKLKNDVYIKNVSLNISIDKNNVISNLSGSCTVSGKDEQNLVHLITTDFVIKISNIDKTVITAPDLTDKKVVENQDGYVGKQPELSTAFIGKYHSDITTLKDGNYVKTGDRYLEITYIKGTTLRGTYYEMIDNKKSEIQKITTVIQKGCMANFGYTNTEGIWSSIYLNFDQMNGTISSNFNNSNALFTRVF